MQGLFDRVRDMDGLVMRNIVSLRTSEDLFDDLHGGDAGLADVAVSTEMAIKPAEPPTVVDRGFHYATAILYPFRPENWLRTRYSDGRHPAWYGSLDADTTIWETGYHAMRAELAVENADPIIHRERAVYQLHCRGLLIDVSAKAGDYPDLVSDDYGFCQRVGERVHQEGHPGLLAPSARHSGGINLVAFRRGILQEPRVSFYLTYSIDTTARRVIVQRTPGTPYATLNFSDTFFWD